MNTVITLKKKETLLMSFKRYIANDKRESVRWGHCHVNVAINIYRDL